MISRVIISAIFRPRCWTNSVSGTSSSISSVIHPRRGGAPGLRPHPVIGASEQVPFADDPDQLAGLVHDRRAADTLDEQKVVMTSEAFTDGLLLKVGVFCSLDRARAAEPAIGEEVLKTAYTSAALKHIGLNDVVNRIRSSHHFRRNILRA
jgi:hypothetical protein